MLGWLLASNRFCATMTHMTMGKPDHSLNNAVAFWGRVCLVALLLSWLSATVVGQPKEAEGKEKNPKSRVTFFVLGDPQYHDDFLRTMVARIAAENPDFVLMPGDCCIANGADPRPWDEFFDIFGPLTSKPNRLYAIPGNHDLDGGFVESLRYWQERWDLPGRKIYYSFQQSSVYVAGLFVNNGALKFSDKGPKWPLPVGDTSLSQLEWVDKDIKALPESNQWRILFHHEPGPRYGFLSPAMPELYVSDVSTDLEGLAFDNDVDIIIRGHHHLYERTYPIDIEKGQRDDARGVTMITSGGGNVSFITPKTFGFSDELPWYDAVFVTKRPHYCKVVVDGNRLTWEAIDLEGVVFDRFQIEKTPDGRRTWQGLPKNDTLLKIVNHHPHNDSPAGRSWGDGSRHKRYVVHFDVPSNPVRGGIDFSHPKAYLAVNDAFMRGLSNFAVSLWFEPREDGPKGLDDNGNGGVLICSNWATPNNGDWLVGFNNDGALQVLVQEPDGLLTGKTKNFRAGERYHVVFRKSPSQLSLWVNGQLESTLSYPHEWSENGAPLSIGANPYDRHGMGFFNGVIGDVRVETTKADR